MTTKQKPNVPEGYADLVEQRNTLRAACRDALRAFRSMYDDMEQGKDFDDIFDDESYWPLSTIQAAIKKGTPK